jgi:hypothetical protein
LFLIVAHEIKFDVSNNFQGNALEDLALSNGQYWVHCKKEEVFSFFFNEIFD